MRTQMVLIRRFYAKNTDFNTISEAELERLQNRLNNRPKKVLGYYSPAEMIWYETQKMTNIFQDYKGVKMGNKSSKDLFSFLIPAFEKN